MRNNTIKEHASALKEADLSKYNTMLAELAKYNQLAYFQGTLCRASNADYNLREVKSIVRDVMCDFLGFTARNFRENTMPELPERISSLITA